MKMANINSDVVFERLEKSFRVELSPSITVTGLEYDKSDLIFARLLSSLKGFNKAIHEIRKRLRLNESIPYPQKPTARNVIEPILSLNKNQRESLESYTEEILKRYKLTKNWRFSIEMAVLTDVLLVPSKENIEIHYPNLGTKVVNYPAIYFVQRTTINELKEWLNNKEVKKLIREIQSNLPEKKIFKTIDATLFWGQIVHILKQEGTTSWAMIDKKIDELTERFNREGFFKNPPIYVELRKYYERFVNLLHKVEIK